MDGGGVVSGLPPAALRLIELALDEDLGRGDVTSEALVDESATARGAIVTKEPLVVSGLDVALAVFARVSGRIEARPLARAGEAVPQGSAVVAVQGPARAVLGAERTALNFLQRLCGVATLTRRYVDAARAVGSAARIADTRKTTPGFRFLEKRAVRDGGGANHRADLASGILIKDNHVALYGVQGAIDRARKVAPHGLRIEIEVTSLAQLEEALSARVDVVLLDNFEDAELVRAVAAARGRALVEVSGGVTLERVARLGAAGVDVISIGRLTHSAPAVDLSLELEPSPHG
jgi:nicotinate-nucleotide pyrophosphorylase (carboxylating)